MNPLTLLKKIAHKIKSLVTNENLSDYRLNNNKIQSNKKLNKPNKKEPFSRRRNKYGFPRFYG